MVNPKLVLCHLSNSDLGIQGCWLDRVSLGIEPTTEGQSQRTWHANNANLCHGQQACGCFKAPNPSDGICLNCPSSGETRAALTRLLSFAWQHLKLWGGAQIKTMGQRVTWVVPPVSEVAGGQQLGDVLTILELPWGLLLAARSADAQMPTLCCSAWSSM